MRQGVQPLAAIAVRQTVFHCDGVAVGIDHAAEAGGGVENHSHTVTALFEGNGVACKRVFVTHIVGAIAAVEAVVACSGTQKCIITQTAEQLVAASAAHQRVIPGPCVDGVIARTTLDAVHRVGAGDAVSKHGAEIIDLANAIAKLHWRIHPHIQLHIDTGKLQAFHIEHGIGA